MLDRQTSEGFSPHFDTIALTIVVPALDEARFIAQVLDGLLDQDLADDRYEILVVDGGSCDTTRSIVRSRQRGRVALSLLDNPRRRASAARNVGLRAARGDAVLYVDGHCRIPSRTMLRHVVRAFADGAVCISRPQPLLTSTASRCARAIAWTRSSMIGHLPGSHIYDAHEHFVSPTSAGCGYSMRLLRSIGGFDESFDAAEDVDLNHRFHQLGLRALHSDRFTVQYYARDTLRGLFRQMLRYGIGRGRLWVKHPSALTVPAVAPGLLTSCFFLALGLTPLHGPSGLVVLLIGLAVAMTGSIAGLLAVRQIGPFSAFLVVPTILAILAGAGLGSIAGLASGVLRRLRVA